MLLFPRENFILILFTFKITRSPLHFGVAGLRKKAMKNLYQRLPKGYKAIGEKKRQLEGVRRGGGENPLEFLLLLNTPTLKAAQPPPPPRGLGSANEKAKPGPHHRNDFPVAFLQACCFIIAEVDIYFQ